MGNRDKDNERSQSGENKQRRGFAAMDQTKQREIASMGGHAAHRSGNAHEFDSEEAREAGRKGGQASARNRATSARNDNGHGTGNR
ncbi:MAG: KGG domain-containing protein [Lysobacteraceae bacterium]